MEVPELAADLGQLMAMQADLTVLAAGIVDVQDPLGMAEAAGTFGTAFGVEGFAMNEGTAEDIAEVWKIVRSGNWLARRSTEMKELCLHFCA